MPNAFDRSLAMEQIAVDRFRGETDRNYWNMIGPFGGWIAAALLKAAAEPNHGVFEPLSATVDYMRGLPQGGVEITRECVREGRNTRFYDVRMAQSDGPICAKASIILSTRRPTLKFADAVMPDCPGFEDIEPMDVRNMRVEWANRYEIRTVSGAFGEENDNATSAMWIRDAEHRRLDHLSMIALCDAPFPRLFYVTGGFSPISTITMTTYFHAGADELAAIGSAPVFVEARSERGNGGFFDQHSRVFARSGACLATSHQMVWYERPEK